MQLDDLQNLLERIYALSSALRVEDFLISDPKKARLLERSLRARDAREKLLISQSSDALDIALFVHEDVLEVLGRHDPIERLHDDNLEEFLVALEGVSHFLYLVCNAVAGRSVTLLEMELQAEVDKFVTTLFLLGRQRGGRVPMHLHHWLFERVAYDQALAAADLERYRCANRYAGKYCLELSRLYLRARPERGLMAELRRFYRMSQNVKLRHIDRGV